MCAPIQDQVVMDTNKSWEVMRYEEVTRVLFEMGIGQKKSKKKLKRKKRMTAMIPAVKTAVMNLYQQIKQSRPTGPPSMESSKGCLFSKETTQ